MQSSSSIERFFNTSLSKLEKSGDEQRIGERPFVTISRQAGAGGHTVANELIKVFADQEDKRLFGEWQMFDQNLVEMVADDSDMKVSVESLISEQYQTRTDDFLRQALSATAPQDVVVQQIFRLVRHLAGIGKVVIVGRAGAQVTRGIGPSIAVRLIAPENVRVKRMMEIRRLAEKPARDLVRKHDAGRQRLLKRYFKVDVDDDLQYDVTWNTAEVTPRAIAYAIAQVLRERSLHRQ